MAVATGHRNRNSLCVDRRQSTTTLSTLAGQREKLQLIIFIELSIRAIDMAHIIDIDFLIQSLCGPLKRQQQHGMGTQTARCDK